MKKEEMWHRERLSVPACDVTLCLRLARAFRVHNNGVQQYKTLTRLAEAPKAILLVNANAMDTW